MSLFAHLNFGAFMLSASHTTLLHMKRLNKTESPMFIFCVYVFFVSKGNLSDRTSMRILCTNDVNYK